MSFRKIVLCFVLLVFTIQPVFAPKPGDEELFFSDSPPKLTLKRALLVNDMSDIAEEHPGNSVFQIVAGILPILWSNPEFLPLENLSSAHAVGYTMGAYMIMNGIHLFCKWIHYVSHLTEAQPQALSHSSVSHSSKKQSRCQRVYGWVCDRLFGNTDKTVTESAEEQQTRVRRVYNWAYNRLFGTKDKTVIKPSKTTDARNLRDVPNAFKKQTRYRKNIRHILKKKPDELPTHLALYNGWKRSYNIAQNGLSLGLAVVMWPTGVTGIELDMPPHLHPFTYPECPPEYSARQAIAIACLCRVYGLPR